MPTVEIIPYSTDLAPQFRAINEEWIQDMFVLEEVDRVVINDPEKYILSKGGDILFARHTDFGVIGTGALRYEAPRTFELTKMGVTAEARGLNAGGQLLEALIHRARELGAETLYLLTNARCEAAIHLYEKHGFVHSKEIAARFGKSYDRCNVAMRWEGNR